MSKIREKHLERLSQGKKSGMNIGSRSVPHHLRPHEQKRFHLAIKHQFLVIDTKDRINLWNIWEKYCSARNWPEVVCKKLPDGFAELWVDGVKTNTDQLQVIKAEAKSSVTRL